MQKRTENTIAKRTDNTMAKRTDNIMAKRTDNAMAKRTDNTKAKINRTKGYNITIGNAVYGQNLNILLICF
jgi:hypothetical protein